jgi:hypothetical protein
VRIAASGREPRKRDREREVEEETNIHEEEVSASKCPCTRWRDGWEYLEAPIGFYYGKMKNGMKRRVNAGCMTRIIEDGGIWVYMSRSSRVTAD